MSHIWVSHVTPLNESCHISEWVISHIYMSHVAHLNVPCDKWWMWSHVRSVCHTSEWVMPHIRVSRFTPRNESCHTSEWVMSHIWMRHMIDGGRGPTRARCSDSQPRRPFAAVSLCVQGIRPHTATHCNTLEKDLSCYSKSLCVGSLSRKRLSIEREIGSLRLISLGLFCKRAPSLFCERAPVLFSKKKGPYFSLNAQSSRWLSIEREIGSFFTKRTGALSQKRDRALLQKRPNEICLIQSAIKLFCRRYLMMWAVSREN